MNNIIPKWHSSISEITEIKWNKLNKNNQIPFYSWSWLCALEQSNSIVPRNGWQPLYLSIWRDENIIGIAPLFLKGHSYGEFIFDNQFAELAYNLGLNYYPKLIGMSPVSPVIGYKFLYAENENKQALTNILMEEIDNFCKNNKILSCNFLYCDSSWSIMAKKADCASWINQSSLWESYGEKDFGGYLSRFNANQRKNIRKERKFLKEEGINIFIREANQIDEENMKLMHDFYEQHCARWGSWGSKYLSKEFFKELSSPQLKNNVILFCAHEKKDPNPIAMSLCIRNDDTLWGRYWGSQKELNFLHFELCYYSPISWAIKNNIKYFDPGAGGSQKRRRGFLAKPNISLHRWYDPSMNKLIREWLNKVNKLMLDEIMATNNEVPFKSIQPKLS